MITDTNEHYVHGMPLKLKGLSTDTYPYLGDKVQGKPLVNGSSLLEIDTGKFSFFDEENNEWREL